ncbi:hypothetical protein Tco_0199506 [Tanacetum coccineum]
MDCHDYHSRGYHVISCVDYIPHLSSVSLVCILCLFERYVQELYRGLYRDRRLSISEEALGAFGKSQTYRQNITCWNCNEKGHFHNQSLKLVASKGKEVNMEAGDSDDALLERFKLRSGKVRLADDMTLDIAGIGDVVLKTSFGTSWTLKDVRWFGEAEEYFLHNVSEDKETAEVGATGVAFGVAERLSRTFRAESTEIRVEAPKMLWADSVSMTYLIYGIPYVLIGLRIPEEEWQRKDTSRTLKGSGSDEMRYSFRDTKSHQVIRKQDFHLRTQFWSQENDSIVAEHGLSSEITQSPGGSSDTSEGFENSESFKDSGRSDEEYSEDGASSKEGGFETPQVRRSTRESRAPVRYSPLANYLLLTENGEPESFSKALSSKESVQWKKAIIEEMVSLKRNRVFLTQKRWFLASWAGRKIRVQIEGNYVWTDSSTEAMVDDMLVAGSDMAELNKPKGQLPLVFEMKDRCSKKQVLSYVLTVGVTTVEVLIYVEDSWNEEPCSDVHQVSDEREVEVLRSFNWPPSELITDYGVLPERDYSQFNDVSSGYLVSKVS